MEEKLCPKCKKNPKLWYSSYCKECESARKHKWYEQNKERIRAKHKQYCSENSDKRRKRRRHYYAEHKESILESQREYRKKHSERYRKYGHNQYWAKRNKPVTTTVPLRINLNVTQYSADKWYWTIHNNFTMLYAPVYYASRLEAWDAGREALEKLKEAVSESNKRLLADYEQAK